MNKPSYLLSIITINYNNVKGLNKTINSVLAQTYPNIQFIVIDGGSTDGSFDVIKQNASKFDYWVSEPDKGVYHAQNKGIEKSTGDYLLFLNSGDYLSKDTILDDVFAYNFDEDIVYGDLYFDAGSIGLTLQKYPSMLTFDYFYSYSGSLPHPCSLIKKSLFFKVGLYNQEFKIVSDWEFWLKAIFLHQASYKRIPLPISVFMLGGLSSNEAFYDVKKTEMASVFKKYFGGIIEDYNKFNTAKEKLNSNFFIKVLKKLNLFKFDL